MLKEELEKTALSIVEVPLDFRKIIENYTEDEAYFSWIDKEEEKGVIGVKLDTEGRLTYMTIDMQKEDKNTKSSLTVEKKQAIAEQYLLHHYPDALQHFTYYYAKELEHCNCTRFYYEQLVMEIPLRHGGSYIDVNDEGEVILFNYKGVKSVPHIPGQLIPKEKLTEHVLDHLQFELVIDQMHKAVHDVEEDSLRLVYCPQPLFMKYKAEELTPKLTVEQEETTPEITRPLPSLAPIERTEQSREEIIGITDKMEIIREVDLGDELGIVWRERDWKPDEGDLSFEAYFKEHTEETVKAFLSKETGNVRSFLWFHKRTGSLQLSREACFEKACRFLQQIIPEFLPYLQYIVPQSDENRKNETKEFFSFKLVSEQGIFIQSELISIAVNRNTGQVDQYSGPRIDVQQLQALPNEPIISTKQAFELFKEHLDFKLVWDKEYENEEEIYKLVYKACGRYTKTDIQAIDAITGGVICSRN